jgi:hypothetical protein
MTLARVAEIGPPPPPTKERKKKRKRRERNGERDQVLDFGADARSLFAEQNAMIKKSQYLSRR